MRSSPPRVWSLSLGGLALALSSLRRPPQSDAHADGVDGGGECGPEVVHEPPPTCRTQPSSGERWGARGKAGESNAGSATPPKCAHVGRVSTLGKPSRSDAPEPGSGIRLLSRHSNLQRCDSQGFWVYSSPKSWPQDVQIRRASAIDTRRCHCALARDQASCRARLSRRLVSPSSRARLSRSVGATEMPCGGCSQIICAQSCR